MTNESSGRISDDEIDAISERLKGHLRQLNPQQLAQLNHVLDIGESHDEQEVQGYMQSLAAPRYIIVDTNKYIIIV